VPELSDRRASSESFRTWLGGAGLVPDPSGSGRDEPFDFDSGTLFTGHLSLGWLMCYSDKWGVRASREGPIHTVLTLVNSRGPKVPSSHGSEALHEYTELKTMVIGMNRWQDAVLRR
jgi:hypothetical protein